MGRTLAAALGVTAGLAMVWLVDGNLYDFIFDWFSAEAIAAGVDPYAPVSETAAAAGWFNEIPHSHPRLPGALLVGMPFSLLTVDTFHIAGRILTVALVVVLLWQASGWSRTDNRWWLAATPLVLVVIPEVLASSKWAAVAVATLIGMTVFARESWWSGVPLGVAVTLKMWPWVVVPALWVSGRRKSAVGAAVAFGTMNLAGLALPGVTLSGLMSSLQSAADYGLSLSIVDDMPLWALVVIGLAAVVVIHVALPDATVPMAVAVGVVLSPILWASYLVALVVPAVWLANRLRGSEGTPVDEHRVLGAEGGVSEQVS